MGQRANSGRNASLDDKKERMAGRRGRTGQNAAGRGNIKDAYTEHPAKGKTGGAFGKKNQANRAGGVGTRGAGGGGGESSETTANSLNTGRTTRPARKR